MQSLFEDWVFIPKVLSIATRIIKFGICRALLDKCVLRFRFVKCEKHLKAIRDLIT